MLMSTSRDIAALPRPPPELTLDHDLIGRSVARIRRYATVGMVSPTREPDNAQGRARNLPRHLMVARGRNDTAQPVLTDTPVEVITKGWEEG